MLGILLIVLLLLVSCLFWIARADFPSSPDLDYTHMEYIDQVEKGLSLSA